MNGIKMNERVEEKIPEKKRDIILCAENVSQYTQIFYVTTELKTT